MQAAIFEFLRLGNIGAALTRAQQWVVEAPDNADAYHALALCLQRNDHFEPAYEAIDKAIALTPDRAEFLVTRASLSLNQREVDLARKNFEEAIKLDPNQLPAYLSLVHIAITRSDLEEAERQLTLARRVDANHPRILIAEGMLSEAKGDKDAALAKYTAAVEADPSDVLALSTMGMAFMKGGQYAFAEQSLARALSLRPNAMELRSARAAALRRLNRIPEALEETKILADANPDNLPLLLAHAEMLGMGDQLQAALDTCSALLKKEPNFIAALELSVNLLFAVNQGDRALELVDLHLDRHPQHDQVWQMRLAMSDPMEIGPTLDRWQSKMPAGGGWRESRAVFAERDNELEAAEKWADEALELTPALPYAQYVKLRAELRSEPAKALERLNYMAQFASSASAAQQVLAWRALANHRCGNYADAFNDWQKGLPLRNSGAPLPRPMDERADNPSDANGVFLWGLPGSRVERLAAILSESNEPTLLADRINGMGRDDGFGRLRRKPSDAAAGSGERWQAALAKHNLKPDEVIDWLPHWDFWTHSALANSMFLVAIRDPRDLLINWLGFGSSVGYAYPGADSAARWLNLELQQLVRAQAEHPKSIHLFATDALDHDADALCSVLQRVLGSRANYRADRARAMGFSLGQTESDFKSGQWRNYRDLLGDAFAQLSDIAQKLGYSAD